MSEESGEPSAGEKISGPSTSVSRLRGRVFSDAEITRILETATELQERSDSIATGSAHGLTVEDLRQVAREVGIDPRFVDIAVTEARGPVGPQGNALAGGPLSWRFHSEIPGEISDADRGRILQEVRSIMSEKGEFADIYGRMEWSHDDGLGPIIVGISKKGESTEIDISANRRGEAGMLFGVGVTAGGFLGGAAVAGLIGVAATPAALPVAVAMAGVSYGIARLGWRVRSLWWERRLQRTMDHLSSTVQDIALPVTAPKDDDS